MRHELLIASLRTIMHRWYCRLKHASLFVLILGRNLCFGPTLGFGLGLRNIGHHGGGVQILHIVRGTEIFFAPHFVCYVFVAVPHFVCYVCVLWLFLTWFVVLFVAVPHFVCCVFGLSLTLSVISFLVVPHVVCYVCSFP